MSKAVYPSSDVKSKWSALSRQAIREPVTLTVRGRPSLVITSVEDYEDLERFKRERLEEDVRIGFEQLDRGEYSTLTMDEIKAEARRRRDGGDAR